MPEFLLYAVLSFVIATLLGVLYAEAAIRIRMAKGTIALALLVVATIFLIKLTFGNAPGLWGFAFPLLFPAPAIASIVLEWRLRRKGGGDARPLATSVAFAFGLTSGVMALLLIVGVGMNPG